MRALDNHRIEVIERKKISEKMFETKQLREYEDDTYIKVIVRAAYMEKNDKLRRNTSNAFWEYRTTKYQQYYNEAREKKRRNRATRRKRRR